MYELDQTQNNIEPSTNSVASNTNSQSSVAADVPQNGVSIASMVCGICSIVFCWCYGIVGIVSGIVAIALYIKAKKDASGVANGMAKAGFICGIIGTALSVIFLIYFIIVVVILDDALFFLADFDF